MFHTLLGWISIAWAVSTPGAGREEPVRVPDLEETVRVERVLLEVRVLDGEGRPVRGLTAGDFRVRADGDDVRVRSVDWLEGFGGNPPGSSDLPPTEDGPSVRQAGESPRYTVLLVQRDLDPSRIVQLMRLKQYAAEWIDDAGENDRVALLLHEHGLHVLSDFTNDRERLHHALDEAVVRRESGNSRTDRLGGRALGEAVHVETALLRVAEVLEGLPGSKTVVFFAWGMGVFTAAGVMERADQDRAVEHLLAAHATLLTIDLTNADYHSLEEPLIGATRATGGLYVKGHVRPALALQRLRDAAAGHYLLTFAPPDPGRAPRRVHVSVPGTGFEVLYRESLED